VAEKSIMDEALRYLSRQAYSERKLSDRLRTADYSEIEIGECFTRLKNWGYLNDREFGTNRIKQLQGRFKSRSFTMLDLESQGLPKDLLTELINFYYSEERELAIAQELLLKKGNTVKSQSKMWNYLLRAGFTENTVRHCFPSIDPT
jgi:regulatory protein